MTPMADFLVDNGARIIVDKMGSHIDPNCEHIDTNTARHGIWPKDMGFPCGCIDLKPTDHSGFADVIGGGNNGGNKGNSKANGGKASNNGMTEKQKNFIHSLMGQKGIDENGVLAAIDNTGQHSNLQRLSKREASQAIEYLLARPNSNPQLDKVSKTSQSCRKRKSSAEKEKVMPSGKYALREDNGNVRFFSVQHGKPGSKWDSYTFVSAIAGSEEHKIRDERKRNKILHRILEMGSFESAALYGQEIGECGVCSRQLTNEESRAAGIGPICRAKF